MRYQIWSFLITTFFLAVWPTPSTIKGQTPAKQISNEHARQMLQEIEQQLQSLKKPPAHQPVISKQTTAFVILDDTNKGVSSFNQSPNNSHYFLTRLILVNQSQQTLKLVRDQIKAKVNGKAHPISDLPRKINNQSVRRPNISKYKKEIEVPPGKRGGLWIPLYDLPADPQIPEIELQITLNGQLIHLNVNRFELGHLQHSVQLMGPNQCLAKLTVKGELNSINIAGLMHEVDLLTAQKNIRRFVIHFPNQAAQIESAVKQWLLRAAGQVGINTIVAPPLPLFPRTIQELHLSGKVFKDAKVPYLGIRPQGTQVIHETEGKAIHAALESAMRVLSREKISEQIRSGLPAVKIAALISGGRQLTNEELPLVLELSENQNRDIQNAALYALRYFRDPRAFERLSKTAHSPPGAQFEMAIASLAESRFSEGQTLLLKLLKQHSPDVQKVIIGIISQSPRPQWNEAIFSFLSSKDLELRKAAIKALVLNGHPQLLKVLTDTLNSPHAEFREVAFQELIKRRDLESESLAMNYILEQLQHKLPTQVMLSFIDRLKDHRAIPLLSLHLQDPKTNTATRTAIIKTLASIGDQTVEEEFLKFYPRANDFEKVLILKSLQKLESPHFFRLAKQALQDKNLSFVKQAVTILRTSESKEAVLILQKALETTIQSSIWADIFSALGAIGTPEARQTIMQARHTGKNYEKQKAARVALAALYRNSPGHHYYTQGQRQQSQKQWRAAITHYETAISIDAALVPAYVGIVNAQNALKQYEEALKYADLGLSIDNMHFRLYAAKGMIFSNQSKRAEALKFFNKAISLAPQETFPYTLLASHYAKYKQFKEALQTYDAAIKANPRYMNTYEFKADLLLSLEKPEEALKTYDSAIAVNNRHTRSYYKKIELLRKLKRYDQALSVCDDILKLNKKSLFALMTKVSIFRQLSRPDDAIAACDSAIQIRPDDLDLYFTKVQIFNDISNWDGALKVYDQIISKDKSNVNAFTGRGHTNLQKQDWKSAEKDFQKAFTINKKSTQAISGLAICMVYNHEEDKAIPFVEGYVKQFENNGLFRYNVACVFGRALINLKDQAKTPDVLKRTQSYQTKALAHLTSASQNGFNEVDWMQKDPDLSELHALPAFKSLVQTLQKKSEAKEK